MELDLAQYSLTRPHKVTWLAPAIPPDPIDIIKSKTTKKFLRNNLETFLKDYQLSVDVQPITESEFVEWLKYYEAKMIENDFQVIASLGWYQDKIGLGTKVYGIYVKQNGTLLGAGIVSISSENVCTINFKASDKTDFSNYRNVSLGTIIEYYFLKLCYELKATVISSGTSRNAFGVINKLGYLNFKTRFGYTTIVSTKDPIYQTVEVLEQQPVCFYAYQNPEEPLQLYVYNHKQPLSESLKEVLAYTEYKVLD